MDYVLVSRAILRSTREHIEASVISMRATNASLYFTSQALDSSQLRIQQSDALIARLRLQKADLVPPPKSNQLLVTRLKQHSRR